ncbi:MAG TPA: GNAT family N-acetyltransferase [Syntrophales bacterium]|nr:GNAT family N-acetyltransferase [Syntrophales bacterium]
MKTDASKLNPQDGARIRALEPRDRSPIEKMVVSSGKFNDVEIATALELVEEALEEGEESGYLFAVLEHSSNSAVLGYACYGPVPLTLGVYDLYWIVVDPSSQGKGYGRRLIEYVEKDVLNRGGRMILIETSSQETYGATVRFYEGSGYRLAARIENFYRIGDDKLIFQKELS